MNVSSSYVVCLLDYDPVNGAMHWKPRQSHQVNCPELLDLWNRKYAGKRAGSYNRDGYEVIRVGLDQFRTNRLVWELHHGSIPDGMQIDHINGDRAGQSCRQPARCNSCRKQQEHEAFPPKH